MTVPLRRAGARWRILVHERAGRDSADGLRYGQAHDISSDPAAPRRHAETRRQMEQLNPEAGPPGPDTTSHIVLERTEFDELVVGKWIHLEQLDTGRWYLNVGGVMINITADRDGRPKVIDVYGPGDYADAVDGCKYELTWSCSDDG